MARLKVYASAQGFYDTVVAAPSQKAALEAWGTHQNLFGQGMASVVTDPETVKAALARPGEVLSRPAGSREPYKPSGQAAAPRPPKALPKPKLAKPKGGRAKASESKIAKAPPKAKPAPKPPPKPKPDRAQLTAAQKALKEAKAARTRELAALERERKALDRRERATTRRLDAEIARLEKARDQAAQAFAKAGGADRR